MLFSILQVATVELANVFFVVVEGYNFTVLIISLNHVRVQMCFIFTSLRRGLKLDLVSLT